MSLQKNQAIQTALTGNWELAISINEEILQENPEDIETLNRVGFAYTVVGRIKDAKKAYQRVLEIDVFNPIALKNLKRLGEFTPGKISNGFQLGNDMFLEESGKTKIIGLVNTAPPKLIKTLQVGQSLHLLIKRSKIFVLDSDNQYIGMLPDNISIRLIKFIHGGNLYDSYVKSIEQHGISIFIREKKRTTRFKNQASFTDNQATMLAKTPAKSKTHLPSSSEDGA